MPLFSRRDPTPPPTTTTTSPARKPSLFSRRRSSSPSLHDKRHSTHHSHHTTTTTSTSPKRTSGMFGRSSHDPSITAATQSLRQAEAAERDADRALYVAKNAVREAREHVHRLEREVSTWSIDEKGMDTDEVDSRLLKRRDLQKLSRRRRRRLGRRDGLWDVSTYQIMLMAVSTLS